ncbi:MAG: nucleotidyl transferase AbiEii/AbiGii toxin family protein [Candidatus Omnitrophica bacterium]|nr:nucleotidyl transferase AbiEii/AbiGii toxin family protein [Candidatus Omnitrophota bacterium]
MLDILKQQLGENLGPEEKLNRAREFLQIIILKVMYDKNILNNLAFVGGTALRILYNLKRFSEDLDFSLINKKKYDFNSVSSEIIKGLKLYGFEAEPAVKADKTVQSSMLKFSGLLKELGISALGKQKLAIKIEVDANPPAGWHIQNTVVNKSYMFNVVHFDLSSLYATKLHACFYRKFTKGRDFYDFIWYLSNKIKPNFTFLNNAIIQTSGHFSKINEQNFKAFLLDKISGVDFNAARRDVGRFLEDKEELKLIDLKIIRQAIESAI